MVGAGDAVVHCVCGGGGGGEGEESPAEVFGGLGLLEVWCWLALALGYGAEFHDAAFEAAEGVAHVEGEAEALHDEKFWGDYVVCGGLARDAFGELPQGEVVVVGFGGEEEGTRHDLFGVVGHRGVGEVEAAEVLDCGGLWGGVG